MTSTESTPVVISVQNTTAVRTNKAQGAALARGNYIALDTDLMKDDRVSFRARSLFALLLTLSDFETPSIKWLATKTEQGKSTVLTLLRELEIAGWISRRPLKFCGARREIIDLLGSENWALSTGMKSVLIETDNISPQEESVPNEHEADPSRSYPEPTWEEVGSIQDRPDESNPCAPTHSTPLIKAEEKYKQLKGREGGIPILSLVEGGRIFDAKPTINWVVVAKLIEESFDADRDFTFAVLNPFVKNEATLSGLASLEAFADWLLDCRQIVREGNTFRPTRNNLRLLWADFNNRVKTDKLA